MEGQDMKPRPYQAEALQALNDHMMNKETNPCVVIPTAGGKSIIMAWAIQGWKHRHPPFRCIILAHRKELVEQNSDELKGLWPGGDIGVYAAGLGKRDMDNDIMYASIDSVYSKWGEFPPFDCIIVDEAHRIPVRGEGKYRQFINGCKIANSRVKTVGFTATPYRLGSGPICHRDHILNEICYEANVGDLIEQGYVCKLRSKVSAISPDMTNVRKNGRGDYVEKSLAEATDTPKLVQETIQNAVGLIKQEGRKAIVFFCVSIDHCHHVSQELRKYGIIAPAVTGKTPKDERDRIAENFKKGRLQAICNVNVYTEGFNAKRVDCVVLLRPTLSAGLFIQMVGRGLRLHPDKQDCLVLDYAHCIEEHGPLDHIGKGHVRLTTCKQCGDTFSTAIKECPHCGWQIPPREIEKMEAEERERRMHEKTASNQSILGNEPQELKVDEVTVHRHSKQGSPDSVRVQYRCGLATIREWICLDHDGYAQRKSRKWWSERFGPKSAADITVDKALEDIFLAHNIREATESIVVRRQGKNYEILRHNLRGMNN